MAEFKGFPKLHRLFRTITVTEKLDGTNACVVLEEMEHEGDYDEAGLLACAQDDTGLWFSVYAQSRKRLITPDSDNYGFARWVQENIMDLVKLGAGRHYGEWWGGGIQRNYGLDKDDKRFWLFNPDTDGPSCVGNVPVLYTGEFSQNEIEQCLLELKERGSQAVPGFMETEGIVIYHHHGRHSYKVTLDDQDKHKWEVE